jgi:hypothetical protein
LDELKTHLRGAQLVLRSKTPDLVKQEFYGFMLAHFAVRGLMHEAALKADEDPDQLSFLHAVRVIRRKLPTFSAIPPQQKTAFHEAVLDEILEERVVSSRRRWNPRGIKRKMSNYPVRSAKGNKHLKPSQITFAYLSEQYCLYVGLYWDTQTLLYGKAIRLQRTSARISRPDLVEQFRQPDGRPLRVGGPQQVPHASYTLD